LGEPRFSPKKLELKKNKQKEEENTKTVSSGGLAIQNSGGKGGGLDHHIGGKGWVREETQTPEMKLTFSARGRQNHYQESKPFPKTFGRSGSK